MISLVNKFNLDTNALFLLAFGLLDDRLKLLFIIKIVLQVFSVRLLDGGVRLLRLDPQRRRRVLLNARLGVHLAPLVSLAFLVAVKGSLALFLLGHEFSEVTSPSGFDLRARCRILSFLKCEAPHGRHLD